MGAPVVGEAVCTRIRTGAAALDGWSETARETVPAMSAKTSPAAMMIDDLRFMPGPSLSSIPMGSVPLQFTTGRDNRPLRTRAHDA